MDHKVYESLVYVTARSDDGGHGINVPVRLMYHTRDPFAVSLVFIGVNEDNDGESFVEWSFARDLLASGVVATHRVGDGDIKIWREDHILIIEMHNGVDTVWLRTPYRPVMRFLQEIYRVVPEGYEMNLVDMDGFIESCRD